MSFCTERNRPTQLLIKPDDAARSRSISARLLWALTNSGQIPCVRIGRTVRYDPRDLDAWIMRQKSQSSVNCGGNLTLTSGEGLALVDANTAVNASAA
jgi:predicted DNA-binding transcriptional regulator AlpA